MRWTVGPRLVEMFMRLEFGQHEDDPPEHQRVYAALLDRVPAKAVAGKAVWQFDASLNDLDVMATNIFNLGHEPFDRWDRQRIVKHRQRVTRRIKIVSGRSPFTGKIVGRVNLAPAYHAYRGKVHGHDKNAWPYHPVASACRGGVIEEGTLWPCRFTQAPYRDLMFYRFFTAESPLPPPEVEVILAVSPLRQDRSVLR